ncbi:PAS domain-containing protein [Maridesulfovibrio sp. FT414]|uniref:PAS domain-containing protein n=1 Tax=Maridesulfovibrio sp. FT414 TaxID=2979469 RepID=UPI003D80224A
MDSKKPTYEELEARVAELEKQNACLANDSTARPLLDAATESVFLMDRDGIFITVNKTAAARMGTTVEEMTGKSFREFISPELASDREEFYRKAIEGKQRVRFKDSRDGRIFDHNIAPIVNNDGDVHRLAVFASDITSIVEYENELLDNRHYLNILFNSTLSGVFVVDAETRRIVDVNAPALNMIGRRKEDVVDQVCHEFVCPAERGKCPIADLGHVVDRSERKLLTSGSGERTILKTVKTLILRGKEYYIESFIDINDLKEAEKSRETLIEELSEALEKVKLLSGLMPICSKCKKIRDDRGYWNNLEAFIEKHSEASFSHGLCPHCAEELYGDQEWYIKGRQRRSKKS